jgi:hypothetical protein
MISDRTTFLSAITGWSIILAQKAARFPSVLWRTLCCGLPAVMMLQQRPTKDLPKKYNPKEIFLLVHIEILHYNSSERDFSKK